MESDVYRSFPNKATWSVQGAEQLICSLRGVDSVRIVTNPAGEIEEIHVLTSEDISPKQTVRNVESALRAHYDLVVDHRKISVAQAAAGAEIEPVQAVHEVREEPSEGLVLHLDRVSAPNRILFLGHQVETRRSQRVQITVRLEWGGREYLGEASGADLPRARREALAQATLRALESAIGGMEGESSAYPTLTLDGVKTVDAFDRRFILVAVHAMAGRDIKALAGSVVIDDVPDRAVILATLQATDRWVRGRM